MFEGLSDAANLATVMGLFVAVGGGMKLSGLRLGPIRAFSLAFKSKLFGGPVISSVRKSHIAELNYLLSKTSRDFYVVVIGDKGVGKTCMIDTCVKGRKGVVRVTIPADTKEADVTFICKNAIIGGAGWNIVDQTANLNRVLFWYHIFFAGQLPVVVMTTSERAIGETPAGITGAVRSLSRLGINVVVDASPNSLPPGLLNTTRECVVEVGGLSSDEIREMPQLKDLFDVLKKEHLSDVVLDLLGGIPSLYIKLSVDLERASLMESTTLLSGELQGAAKSEDAVTATVTKFLVERLNRLSAEVDSLKIDSPKFEEVLVLLKDCDKVDAAELCSRGLKLPSPCKILRTRMTDRVVLPTCPMVAFYCKHDCCYAMALDAMLQRIKTARAK